MHERALDHLSKADKTLARLIRRVGPCRWRAHRRRSPFQALVEAVAHQQLNGTAARTILNRVRALHPGVEFPSPADLLDTPEERLRSAGLSRAKTAAVRDIAEKAVQGIVPDTAALNALSDAEIIERLTVIRGVGQWTVEMLLIFQLGRKDVLPINDYGVRKGFGLAYRNGLLPKPAELLAHGERWRPFRSVASWYMWRALDLD